jgi:hypothetical protein
VDQVCCAVCERVCPGRLSCCMGCERQVCEGCLHRFRKVPVPFCGCVLHVEVRLCRACWNGILAWDEAVSRRAG